MANRVTVPTLDDLPSPPEGQTGWPWTEATTPPELGNKEWPSISIVTPSYNQEQFIEETIRSVLLQGYPNLEYYVVDGGSTDGTVDVIQKYEPWLSGWVSEPDRGQSHAINKGIDRCDGEVFNWLNSDDYLTSDSLFEVGKMWEHESPHLLFGRGIVVDAETEEIIEDWNPYPPESPSDLVGKGKTNVFQPSTFVSLPTLKKLGGIREELTCIMDLEMYVRFLLGKGDALCTARTPQLLSVAYRHPGAKTAGMGATFEQETYELVTAIQKQVGWAERMRLHKYLRNSEVRFATNDALSHDASSMASLLRVPLRYPMALCSRFYWGALRRELLA